MSTKIQYKSQQEIFKIRVSYNYENNDYTRIH